VARSPRGRRQEQPHTRFPSRYTKFPTASYNRPHIRAGVPLGGANSQPGPSLCPGPKPQALSRFAPSCRAHSSRPRKKRLSPPARPGPIRIGPEPHVRLAAGKCIVYSLPWGRRRKSTPHSTASPSRPHTGGPGASPSPGSVRPGPFFVALPRSDRLRPPTACPATHTQREKSPGVLISPLWGLRSYPPLGGGGGGAPPPSARA
jgi:hypothetical protein